jgi:hypothetical protein
MGEFQQAPAKRFHGRGRAPTKRGPGAAATGRHRQAPAPTWAAAGEVQQWRPLAARASEQAGRHGGFIWGEMEKKGKKKIEIGKFTKKPYLKLCLFL